MMRPTQIELLPLGPESTSHHLIKASGLCFRKVPLAEKEIIDLVSASLAPLSVTNDIFEIIPIEHAFWNQADIGHRIQLLFNLSEFHRFAALLQKLLQKDITVNFLFHQIPSDTDLQVIAQFLGSFSSFRFIYLESYLSEKDPLFLEMPRVFLEKIYFCFLPKESSMDAFLPERSVLDRIEFYENLLKGQNQKIRLFVLTNKILLTNSFYINPNLSEYLSITKKKRRMLFQVLAYLNKIKLLSLVYFPFYVTSLVKNRGFIQVIRILGQKIYFFFKRQAHSPVFYPIKKIYWFCEYQYKKRISKTLHDE